MSDDHASAMADLTQAIAHGILTLPELDEPEWDTFSLAAEVTDDYVAMTAYRYTQDGPPVSTEEPEDDDPYWDLRELSRGADGQTWDVVLVKIHRDTANLVLAFLSGADADRWRITPANMEHLAEALRPRPEDFEPA